LTGGGFIPFNKSAAWTRVPKCNAQEIDGGRMSEDSVIIDGIRSPVLEFGPADSNEAVVFVHGNPGSIREWDVLARGVGEFGCAVAMIEADIDRARSQNRTYEYTP
jgi:hypothetical protein